MAKRQFLMQAHTWNRAKVIPNGWYLSEKLDGFRCFWDGGITRGLPKNQIGWANCNKDARLHVATGLWSRYANVIHAPGWFLDTLPQGVLLDGELWAGRGNFQKVASIVRKLEPTEEWKQIQYRVFDSPSPYQVFQPGKIDLIHCKISLVPRTLSWAKMRLAGGNFSINPTFVNRNIWLKNLIPELLHEQIELPYNSTETLAIIDQFLNTTLLKGGEGIVLRNPNSTWIPERVHSLLKLKDYHDAEATVIGYTSGRKGLLLGKIGALVVTYGNVTFELSGLTHLEREFADGKEWATENPGERCPDELCTSTQFPCGTRITFRYRELTDGGIPKDARYLRKHVTVGT